jgi:hypothetical protein
MESDIMDKVCQQVYRKFPEVNGIKPSIKSQPSDEGQHYLLTFKGNATTPDGKILPRIVRVVANDKGKLIKLTTSR